MRKVLDCDSPILRKKSKPITKIDDNLIELIKEMFVIMKTTAPKGIGFAAPQIGELIRLVVIDYGEGEMVFINPEILSGEGECIYKEGCLSIPGLWADIKRAEKVRFACTNLRGKRVEGEATGILARVLQHEIDHLDGKLFTDYIEPGQEIELDEGVTLPKRFQEKLMKGDKK
ncbi:MAG TPA: peptide deformylase [Caldisericia bacterium]|nr:peptide deformylase [Caldisericia bacterium]HOU08951.1 peptide deformylase [Caldisericia bacterium]HPL90252.1 peptide deformylase [Caldisericia bacterium]HQG60050.1 peptide deformylase [Caldisericia bacterium]HQH49503.1 peptide deformylase [Caldisericia bacterium]